MSQTETETFELTALASSSQKNKKALPRTIYRLAQQTRGKSQKTTEPEVVPHTEPSDQAITQEVSNPATPDVTTTAIEAERWNSPGGNMYRVFATFWAFIVMGANDAAYGPIIPYMETYYTLSYTVVSLIFFSPFIGYTSAALLNNAIHMRFGQRGIAILAPSVKVIAYVVICVHPPFPLIVIMGMLAGFGNGLQDGAWNAWIGAMANANQLLGFLHGFYGLGATISPFIATTMITKGNLPWYSFYYIMIGFAAIELTTSVLTFYHRTGQVYRDSLPTIPSLEAATTNPTSSTTPNVPKRFANNRMHEALFTRPSARVTWLCAFFLFGYVGAEVAIGGWVVSFMLKVRHGSNFASGMVATGFWLGITVGRVILGFVTPIIGEKLAISIYLPLALALTLLFWLIPSFISSAVFVSLQGFFLGPLFPGAVVMATKLLPTHLHVTAVGFIAAFGGSGGAVFPFAVGAIAQRVGVKALQPVVLGILAVVLGIWLALPRLGRKRE